MPRPKQPEIPQAKLLKVIQIWHEMSKRHVSIEEITRRYDVSSRTAYRYVKLPKEVNLMLTNAPQE